MLQLGAATAAWTTCTGAGGSQPPYVARQHALLLFGSICCIAYVETACHELGHLVTGLIYRMLLAQVTQCSLHKEMELIAPRWTFAVCLLPGGDRVDFYAYRYGQDGSGDRDGETRRPGRPNGAVSDLQQADWNPRQAEAGSGCRLRCILLS